MIDEYWPKISTFILVALAATIGRLMYHAKEVQRGNRRFWSFALLLDLLIAIGMGIIAYGLCSWWSLSGASMAATCAVAGYLGPHAIDAIFNWKFGSNEERKGG